MDPSQTFEVSDEVLERTDEETEIRIRARLPASVLGRLRREREMRLERDLGRVMLISLLIVASYFAVNAMLTR